MKGLNCNFPLVEGRFQLTQGAEKARDSIWFFSIFDKKRPYTMDYGANFISLLQKPLSYVQINRHILINLLRVGVERYVPEVTLQKVDFGYLKSDRKSLHVQLEYTYQGEQATETEVIFI